VVVGGGFIGVEIASTLETRGIDTTIVATSTLPLERVFGRKVGAAVARWLEQKKIRFFGASSVKLFKGITKVRGVELTSGEVLPADFVVVAAGVLPDAPPIEPRSAVARSRVGGWVVQWVWCGGVVFVWVLVSCLREVIWEGAKSIREIPTGVGPRPVD
jgi:NADPH-dependent 2,4-dienoyl-CoA reductase/sulfur reductase-like enzyme